VAKIMNNLNVCSVHSYVYPRSRFEVGLAYEDYGSVSKVCGTVMDHHNNTKLEIG
jgi:hypothetical protein